MREGRPVLEEVLAYSTEDWVFDDDVYTIVSEYNDTLDRESIRAMSLGVIIYLLEEGLMYPVLWEENPWDRTRDTLDGWEGDAWAVAGEIWERWKKKTTPGFSDIVCFGPTKAGFNRGIEVLRREGRRP